MMMPPSMAITTKAINKRSDNADYDVGDDDDDDEVDDNDQTVVCRHYLIWQGRRQRHMTQRNGISKLTVTGCQLISTLSMLTFELYNFAYVVYMSCYDDSSVLTCRAGRSRAHEERSLLRQTEGNLC